MNIYIYVKFKISEKHMYIYIEANGCVRGVVVLGDLFVLTLVFFSCCL